MREWRADGLGGEKTTTADVTSTKRRALKEAKEFIKDDWYD
jgi:hypothetical protein